MLHPQGSLCAHEQSCVHNECLKRCLELFIPCVLIYLRRRRIEEDVATDACSLAWETAIQWIVAGKAAKMTSAHRRGALCRTAYHIACDIRRRQSRSLLGKAESLADIPRRDEPAGGVDPLQALVSGEETALLKEEATLLKRCLAVLGDDDRCLLELRYVDDATFAEIAELLGCCEAKAWRQVNAALERLTALFIRGRSFL